MNKNEYFAQYHDLTMLSNYGNPNNLDLFNYYLLNV